MLVVSKGHSTENERVGTRMLRKALSSSLNMASTEFISTTGRLPCYVVTDPYNGQRRQTAPNCSMFNTTPSVYLFFVEPDDLAASLSVSTSSLSKS